MATMSTSAWVLHDLGLAASFGGALYGELALQPAIKDISSPEERGKLLHDAWYNYTLIDAVSLGAMTLPWLLGRSMISGRSMDHTTRGLVRAKDVLVAAALVTGVANIVSNRLIGKEGPGGAIALGPHGEPTPRTPPRATQVKRFLSVSGPVYTACIGGIIGITAALAMKSGRSGAWKVISSLLP